MSPETKADPHVRASYAESDFTLLRVFNVLLARWRLMVLLPLTFMAVSVIMSLMSDRSYRTLSSLIPDGASAGSPLAGLAAQFGVSVGSQGGGESVVYHEKLFRSREILRELAYSKYTVRSGPEPDDTMMTGTFMEIAGIQGESENQKTLNALRALDAMITTSTDYESSIITVGVSSSKPDLALQMHKRLLQLTDNYNRDRRRSKAKAERQFVEARLADARRELQASEGELEAFLERNRAFASSPALVFAHQRLQRRVDERQQVYSALAQSYEQARIDEVRNTPVLSVIAPPETVIEPVARGTVRKGILAFLIGLVLAATIAFTRAIFEHKRATASDDYATFIVLTRSIVSGALRVFPEPVRVRLRTKLPSLYAPQETQVGALR